MTQNYADSSDSSPSLGGHPTPSGSADGSIGGDAAFLQIVEALYHPEPDIQQRAMDLLIECGDWRAFDALMRLARDTHHPLRDRAKQALTSLSDFGAEEVRPDPRNETPCDFTDPRTIETLFRKK